MSSETSFDDTIDSALADAHSIADNKPQIPQNQHAFATWVVTFFRAIILAFEIIGRAFGQRIDGLERAHAHLAASATVSAAAPSTAAATESTPAGTTSTAASRKSKRCILCHARGHSQPECRTANAQAMRKRVARNSQIAKQARAFSTMPAPPTVAPPLFSAYPTSPAAPTPIAYAALAADATELRRREAQSARDRRAHQRRAQPS
ncbi:hypothetical protein H0H81_008712 [Sphagnurus paluster]|uniref:Uncharacterized protein n=1 Tax=Sphagnurus paluster TaxID=117069 RepID=A0A9P7KEF9_9AGAR|nr:hypothetical protein H0H81_008712 [Sphagnurus paluster]